MLTGEAQVNLLDITGLRWSELLWSDLKIFFSFNLKFYGNYQKLNYFFNANFSTTFLCPPQNFLHRINMLQTGRGG